MFEEKSSTTGTLCAKLRDERNLNMKIAYAVTGFVPDKLAQALKKGPANLSEAIDVKVERGNDEVVMSIDPKQISEVRTGASKAGETGIQLILKGKGEIKTVIKGKGTEAGIKRFDDPALQRLTARAIGRPIYV
jgi:hypothetical protein